MTKFITYKGFNLFQSTPRSATAKPEWFIYDTSATPKRIGKTGYSTQAGAEAKIERMITEAGAPASAPVETASPAPVLNETALVTEAPTAEAAPAPSETAAADPAPVVAEAPASVPAAPAGPALIKVTLQGAATGTYEGPAGKSVQEMFPSIKGKSFQIRSGGRIVAQTTPWMASAEMNVVEHAKHG